MPIILSTHRLFVVIICLTSTILCNTTPQLDPFDNDILKYSQTMAEAIHLIKNNYYQDITPDKAMIKAIDAFVSLDPHSTLLDPDSYKEILKTTQGEFHGIGVVIDSLKEPKDEFLGIVDTIPGGPADKAGVLPEDKIVQVNDEALRGMSIDEAVAKIKGKRGTSVHIKVLRKGKSKMLSFDITRDTVKEQNAVCFHFTDHNILYLALNMFTQNSVRQLEQLLKKGQQLKAKGIILDLRNNSGGLLNSVVDIAGLFLPRNSVVVITKDRNKTVLERYTTMRSPITDSTLPIFILVNNYTASAAEILAGCLKTHPDNASSVFIVGTKTFGKGSVQEVRPISNDCALKITTALYYLPDDSSVQATGIMPDFVIEQKMPLSEELQWFNQFFGRESALKGSIKPDELDKKEKAEDTKEPPVKSWQERKKERLSNDAQLLSTLRLMEMYDLLHKAHPKSAQNRKEAIELLSKHFNPQDAIAMKEITIQ